MIILLKTKIDGINMVTVYNPIMDGPLEIYEKAKDWEVVHRDDLVAGEDRIIKWRSGADAGNYDPLIGKSTVRAGERHLKVVSKNGEDVDGK